MGSIFQRIRDWWDAADRTQRVVSVVGVALLAAVLGATVLMASSPTMQPVAVGGTDAEKQGMLEELQKRNFRVEVTPGGDVTVPQKDVNRAKMALASANKLPRGGGSGLNSSIGPFDTPNVEKDKLLSKLESEMEESIDTLDGVASSRVHIAPGKESAVIDERVPPTATVNIVESQPGKLSKVEGEAVANLMQGGVSGLKPDGVKVVLSTGRTLYDGADRNTGGYVASAKLEAEHAESKRRTDDLQRELDVSFGKGNTIASVTVTLDMDPTTTDQHTETASDNPVKVDKGAEKLQANASTPNGAAGLEANTPGAAVPGAGTGAQGQKYDSTVNSVTYPLNTKDVKVTKAGGEVSGATYTVTANEEKVKDIASLRKIVESKLGDKLGQAGFSAAVVAVPFDTEQDKAAAKLVADSASAQRMGQLVQLLPAAALLIAGFMVVRAFGKHLASQGAGPTLALASSGGSALPGGMVQIGADGSVHMTPESAQALQALEGDLNGGESRQRNDEDRDFEQTQQVMAALGIDEDDNSVDVEAIKAKINVPLEQIKKMAKRRPEIVAMLLKSWLMEEGPAIR